MAMSTFGLLAVLLYLIQLVASSVDGPFALYTQSSNSSWNNLVLSIPARDAYASLTGPVSSLSDITSAEINFYINTTDTLTPDAPYGNLVWGAQSYFSALMGRIDIVDVTNAVQPIFFDANYQVQGYSTQWNFTTPPNGQQLLLDNQYKFYGKYLHTPMYYAPTVYWLFGTDDQGTDAVELTLWRYNPPN